MTHDGRGSCIVVILAPRDECANFPGDFFVQATVGITRDRFRKHFPLTIEECREFVCLIVICARWPP